MRGPMFSSGRSERNGVSNSQSSEERYLQKLTVWWGKSIGSQFQVIVGPANVGVP